MSSGSFPVTRQGWRSARSQSIMGKQVSQKLTRRLFEATLVCALGIGATGLVVTAGSSTVRGLQITRWSNRGIELSGGSSNLVAGNYIGTDGSHALGDGAAGVIADVGSFNNTIGGTMAADRNVVSG